MKKGKQKTVKEKPKAGNPNAKKNEGSLEKVLKKKAGLPDKVPDTVQNTIPYIRVYDDKYTNGGIIETEEGKFTKSYYLADANYSNKDPETQDEILIALENILNSFNHSNSYEITINNRTIDQEEFNKQVLMEYTQDGFDDLRVQHNTILLDKMMEGKNNLKAEKYLTIGVPASSVRDSMDMFSLIEHELHLQFKKINDVGIVPIPLVERLEIFHDIYNVGTEGNFKKTFNLDAMLKQGITTKDLIGPSSFDFKKPNMFKMGDTYGRVLFLNAIPAALVSHLMESLSSISTNMLLSAHYEAISQDKAVSFASGQITNIGGDVVKAQKNLSRAGASPDLISPKLATAEKDAKELLADLTEGNQKLFHVTVVAVVFAQNEADLNLYTEQIQTKAKTAVCSLKVLDLQQEQGLNTALPLATNSLKTHRIMTSETASAVQPFSTQEIQVKGGFYYGMNPLSKNLIIYNRASGNNQNGVILGSPGAGKSFAAKLEMYQTNLNTTNSQTFVIDPEREYVALANRLSGKVFPITPGGNIHVNPLDLNITRGDNADGDPFAAKVDYVIALCERMLGGRSELSGYMKGIIDNTLTELYQPYIDSLEKRGITIDTEICPTLKDFYTALTTRKEAEARNLASAIQMYCTGTLDLFAYHTNISTDEKFIVYDISNIGTNLWELAMQICLNDIWNRMIANKARSVRTWFYIDEFYLLLQQPSTAQYLQMVWKRARKWMGTPTGSVTRSTPKTVGITDKSVA